MCGDQRYGWVGKHGLEQNTVVLLSSVHDVSQRKAYTVPLPSIEDNEASGTEQRKLIKKKKLFAFLLQVLQYSTLWEHAARKCMQSIEHILFTIYLNIWCI